MRWGRGVGGKKEEEVEVDLLWVTFYFALVFRLHIASDLSSLLIERERKTDLLRETRCYTFKIWNLPPIAFDWLGQISNFNGPWWSMAFFLLTKRAVQDQRVYDQFLPKWKLRERRCQLRLISKYDFNFKSFQLIWAVFLYSLTSLILIYGQQPFVLLLTVHKKTSAEIVNKLTRATRSKVIDFIVRVRVY